MRKILEGSPLPRGATYDGKGTNFAIFSDNATGITLCLFSNDGAKEVERIELTECTNGIWHAYLPDIHPGQKYGYRVQGPWDPLQGQRFNDHKLLLDPYARKLYGDIVWNDALYGYVVSPAKDADLKMDTRDSASFMPKAVVVDPAILVKKPKPNIHWPKTIIYEAHAKGLTMLHPLVPDDIRGTFKALAHPALIEHMHKIGITSLELLPIHAFAQDHHLQERGLRNYWGYNTLSYFTPEPSYLHSGELEEIAKVVDKLHEAGIEVILDVVYNHTCEGNHLGPTLSWKGIDNLSYYRTLPGEPRYYDNLSGCGNSLNTSHPKVLQMVMDSLRLWASVYGVDGFRFDLALTLGRFETGFSSHHPFFHTILQDPILAGCKLIAEPWDVGPGGYQLGSFPPGFSEWNGDYRDVARSFWKGDEGCLPRFAGRFAASSDLFDAQHKRPWSSVNFVTAHDGFTLHDLVAYNEKHNEANGENNSDGANDNRSWNCGVEGETSDPEIKQFRLRQKKNLLVTLFLSQGVPMLLAGDEMCNSQHGNNNTYCQDNEIGWIDWSSEETLIDFVATLSKIRKEHNAISRAEFLTGLNEHGNSDVAWFNVTGHLMTIENWDDPFNKCLIVKLLAKNKAEKSILVMLNAAHVEVTAVVPDCEIRNWHYLISSANEAIDVRRKQKVQLKPRSIYVYESVVRK